MSDDKITAIGLNRAAAGRGWTDLLDNDIAIMQGLLYLITKPGADKSHDIVQGLQYRISQTSAWLTLSPVWGLKADPDPVPPGD